MSETRDTPSGDESGSRAGGAHTVNELAESIIYVCSLISRARSIAISTISAMAPRDDCIRTRWQQPMVLGRRRKGMDTMRGRAAGRALQLPLRRLALCLDC